MTRYYMTMTDLTPGDADREFQTSEEAVEAAKEFIEEILNGVHDEEWGIDPEDRENEADAVRAFSVQFSSSGSIKRTTQLYSRFDEISRQYPKVKPRRKSRR